MTYVESRSLWLLLRGVNNVSSKLLSLIHI